jgi:hypothetical protein
MSPISPDSHSEMLRLLRENNELLKRQERRAKWAVIWKITWFVVFIGLPILAFYYFKDTIEGLLSVTAPLHGGGNFDINAVLELYGLTPAENSVQVSPENPVE